MGGLGEREPSFASQRVVGPNTYGDLEGTGKNSQPSLSATKTSIFTASVTLQTYCKSYSLNQHLSRVSPYFFLTPPPPSPTPNPMHQSMLLKFYTNI